MKPIIKLLAFLFTIIILQSCSDREDPMETDTYPIVLHVFVQNSQGGDLLNPNSSVGLDLNKIQVTMEGKNYPINKDSIEFRTRLYVPVTYVPWLRKNSYYDKYEISIGEYAGNVQYTNEDIAFDWGDGTKDVISFSSPGKGISSVTYYLNGQRNNDSMFFITK